MSQISDEDPLRAALVTISTSKADGDGVDESGQRLVDLADRVGAEVVGRDLIPDQLDLIQERLCYWVDEVGCQLLVTSGGTGVSPTDVTPEATLAVIEREVPGIPEAIRLASRQHTRHWMLSRAVAGIRDNALIINLPGSPKSIDQAADAIAEALPHALALLSDQPTGH